MCIILILLFLAACAPAPTPTPTVTPRPNASPSPAPTRIVSLTDFDSLHLPDPANPLRYLVLGAIPIAQPPAGLPPVQAAFVGRWETPNPAENSLNMVLVISQISASGGKVYLFAGANVQSPDILTESDFKFVAGSPPAIEFEVSTPGSPPDTYTFSYDASAGKLTGWSQASYSSTKSGPYELAQTRTLYVYKDYTTYLASKRIYVKEFTDPGLIRFGPGYLLYLPESYEDDPQKSWPLIFFLHGMGTTGGQIIDLAANSPFAYIREHGPLPAVMVAPLAGYALSPSPFPDEYMEGVMSLVRSTYRIDPQRIYLTGLSMGGEATWRFALRHPEIFAAVAPLSGYYTFAKPDMTPLVHVPVWAIHGSDDRVTPLELGRIPVDALQEAGGNVKFTVLQGYGHDTWTVTYADPAFYEWMFAQTK